MRKYIDHLLHVNTLRKIVGWSTLDEAIRNKLQFEIIQTPPSGRVLVIAPHPDDDVFGAGGTLAKHVDQGDKIRVVYLCDGRLGSKRKTTEIVQEELKNIRRNEAIAAAEILGIPSNQLSFWSYRDGQLRPNQTTIKALSQILSDYMPKIIYVPHPSDNHPDHEAAAKILADTLQAVGGDFPGEIWSYEIWQPTFVNRLVNISDTFNQKEAAMRAHESQLKARPYLEAINGLNTYRGGIMGAGGPAEGFLVMKPKLYLKLWELIRDFK